jgi:hypothetical protein
MGTLGSSQFDNSISDMPNSIFYSKKENGLELKLKDIIANHLGDSNDKKALTMHQFLNILQNKDEALNFSVEQEKVVRSLLDEINKNSIYSNGIPQKLQEKCK